MKKGLLFCWIFLAIQGVSWAQLRLSSIFSSNMVLQQSAAVNIWGTAGAGDSIRLRCSWLPDVVTITQTAQNQAWSATVNTPQASLQAYTIQVTSNTDTLLLNNVLIGEVWLCSGQSNMEWQIQECNYRSEQIMAGKYPHIRHVKIPHALSLTPLNELSSGSWQVCHDTTVASFSAVGYFFAREIADKYQVPVGLINSSWGGSQVESWISGIGMAQSALFQTYMAKFPKTWAEADKLSLEKLQQYTLGSAANMPTTKEETAYLSAEYDLSSWKKVWPHFSWDSQKIWAFRGSACMATDFTLLENENMSDVQLHIGRSDLPIEIYINGQLRWSGKYEGLMDINLPASMLKKGNNRLLVKQRLGDVRGWVEMGLKGNPADFYLSIDGRSQSLADQWRAMPLLNEPFHFVHSSNNLGTAIYNAMIHPITRFSVKGVLWYQGETNAVRAHEYQQSFPLLIQDWRRSWGYEMPFLFVQLASFEADQGNSNAGSEWAELREAQTMALREPKTGMAVTIDIGETKDIHPKNKHDVGHRLAHEARRVAYGEKLLPGSPTEPMILFSNDAVTIQYPNEAEGLVIRNRYGYVNGFELAGADRVFHPAKAALSGNTITVQCATVPQPVAVRYAWMDDPNDVNVFTRGGFPLAPFRSDKWQGKTVGIRFE